MSIGVAPVAVVVIAPGMLTTIQDRGRWGYQAGGVPVAGPMDPRAHRLANALVGNDGAAATLEITFVGPELEFEDERIVAVVGAEFDITVDGRLVPANAPFTAAAGSRLRVGRRRRGARAYLAVRGGLDVPVVLPFKNLGAADDEYFADGMSEEITSRLVKLAGIRVIDRNSAILYRNSGKTPQQIGRELGVDYVLNGTVRWAKAASGPSPVRNPKKSARQS